MNTKAKAIAEISNRIIKVEKNVIYVRFGDKSKSNHSRYINRKEYYFRE